jgi:hypothetical protein
LGDFQFAAQNGNNANDILCSQWVNIVRQDKEQSEKTTFISLAEIYIINQNYSAFKKLKHNISTKFLIGNILYAEEK